MTTRPLIGYPTRSGISLPEAGFARFANNESYARAIADNGGAPVMIPSIASEEMLDAIYARLDGVLITGGPDVAPERYGQERHPRTDEGDPPMEDVELYLIRRALQDGRPLLGICRGIQVITVACGGTLYQDIPDQYPTTIEHAAYVRGRSFLDHTVRIDPESQLGRIVGQTEIGVNSLHHQAVRDMAPGFEVTATAPDGLVEAVERPDLPFALAVQWHPEELYRDDEAWARLFRAFVDAAAHFGERTKQR